MDRDTLTKTILKFGAAMEGILCTEEDQSAILQLHEGQVTIQLASGMFGYTLSFAIMGSGPAFLEGPLGFEVTAFSIPEVLELAESHMNDFDDGLLSLDVDIETVDSTQP